MIIGLQGRAFSGKDTFGVMLSESLFEQTGDVYTLMAFAKSLKEKVQKDFDLSWDQLWGDQKEIEDKRYKRWYSDRDDFKHWTSREILQEYGTFFRSIDGDFWVKELFRTIEDKEYKNVIVTDVRFPNEVDGVSERDGLNIVIVRDVAGSKINAEHISETALDNYKAADIKVDNNGSLDALRATAVSTAKIALLIYKNRMEELTHG